MPNQRNYDVSVKQTFGERPLLGSLGVWREPTSLVCLWPKPFKPSSMMTIIAKPVIVDNAIMSRSILVSSSFWLIHLRFLAIIVNQVTRDKVDC